MRLINIAVSDKAHANLKAITESTNRNQSDIVSEVLERTDVVTFIKELKR